MQANLYSKLYFVTNSVTIMFDTVNLRLTRVEVTGVDFLSEILIAFMVTIGRAWIKVEMKFSVKLIVYINRGFPLI
jgi:hypothetical protein